MEIPRDRLTIRFARSGGPGGQNVNRVETKVEVRFALDEADWLPAAVRGRLRRLAHGRMNQRGEIVVSSERSRSQAQNLEDCLAKLRALIGEAEKVPRRRIPTRPTKASKERRFQSKQSRSRKKGNRRWKPGSGD